MAKFFFNSDYPSSVVNHALEQVSNVTRATSLRPKPASISTNTRIPSSLPTTHYVSKSRTLSSRISTSWLTTLKLPPSSNLNPWWPIVVVVTITWKICWSNLISHPQRRHPAPLPVIMVTVILANLSSTTPLSLLQPDLSQYGKASPARLLVWHTLLQMQYPIYWRDLPSDQ